MSSVRRWLALMLAGILTFAGAALGTASAAAAPTAESNQAASYLAGALDADTGAAINSWTGSPDVGLTIDAVLSLAADGSQPAALAKAAQYVKDNAATYGANSAAAAAKLVIFADAVGIDPSDINGYDAQAAMQATNDYGSAFSTGLALVAYGRMGVTPPAEAVTAALGYIEDDGSVQTTWEPKKADFDGAGLLYQGLVAANVTDPAVQSLQDWLLGEQEAAGSWPSDFNKINTTAVVAPGLLEAGQDMSAAIDWVETQQLDNGALPNAGAADVYATAQGLLLLAGSSLYSAEAAAAGPIAVPAAPRVDDPCGAGNATWGATTDGTGFRWERDDATGELTAQAYPTYTFDDGTATHAYGAAPETNTDPCPIAIPDPPAVTDPCGAGNAEWETPVNGDGYEFSLNDTTGELTASTMTGFVFSDGTSTHSFGTAPETNTAACATVIPVPQAPGVDDPCGPGNATWQEPDAVEGVTFDVDDQGHLSATAQEGYVFDNDAQVVEFGAAPEENTDACPVQTSPPSAKPTPTAAPNNGGLAETGGEPLAMLIAALVLAGSGAAMAGRRR